MVSAIFSTEISTLESQVTALQAQIAQAQQRITALGECEVQAGGAIQALTSAVQKVRGLAPDAIATLKAAVFSLFNSGDSDGSGGLPISPAPQPDLDGQTCEIDPDAYWDSATPDGSSWELATPLCCQMEDAPPESLRGQVYELCCPIQQNVAAIYKDLESEAELVEQPYAELVKVSDAVAYMRRRDGEIISVYAGGSNKGKLRNWGDWLTRIHSVTHGYEIREGKRLGSKWEIKLTSMTLSQIERLAACDFSKDPRTNYPDAPKRPVERVPSIREIEGIGIGDTVRSTTVKNWQYKVTKIDADNFLVCDRLNTNPTITQVLHPGSVELVSKADVVDVAAQELAEYLEQRVIEIAPTPTIDPSDVPRGVVLRSTNDDILIEYNVFAWVIVRNQGRPEPQQRHFGRIVEGLGRIEAYKPVSGRYQAFTTTMDAVNFLINTSDYRQSDIDAGVALFESRQQKVLVGVGAEQSEEVEF